MLRLDAEKRRTLQESRHIGHSNAIRTPSEEPSLPQGHTRCLQPRSDRWLEAQRQAAEGAQAQGDLGDLHSVGVAGHDIGQATHEIVVAGPEVRRKSLGDNTDLAWSELMLQQLPTHECPLGGLEEACLVLHGIAEERASLDNLGTGHGRGALREKDREVSIELVLRAVAGPIISLYTAQHRGRVWNVLLQQWPQHPGEQHVVFVVQLSKAAGDVGHGEKIKLRHKTQQVTDEQVVPRIPQQGVQGHDVVRLGGQGSEHLNRRDQVVHKEDTPVCHQQGEHLFGFLTL
mmetsp:Transcript_177759/g.569957  ORF Transcript_177759/g.569957 Transcript_177759/m.569957 type:complete len:288 (-) Transcript_177759:204-1067(-)